MYRLLLNGAIAWHPTIGREPERLTEDELSSRLERLPYNGCSLKAAEVGGGMNDVEIAEVLGVTRQAVDLIDVDGPFRRSARHLRVIE